MTCKSIGLALAMAVLAVGQKQPGEDKPLKPGLYAVFETSEGNFTAELFEKYPKNSVATFVGLAKGTTPWLDPKTHKLVRRPLYDGVVFHRVTKYQMIQAGDPTGVGNHNCGFTIRDEYFPGLRFDRPGRLAMANTGGENTGGCQFFITDQAIPSWDNKYAIFGQVVTGMDVIHTINRKPLQGERPVNPVTIKHVSIMRISATSPPSNEH